MNVEFSTDDVCPVVLWCSNIGEGAFKYSQYLPPEVLDDSSILTFGLVTLEPVYDTDFLGDFGINMAEHFPFRPEEADL